MCYSFYVSDRIVNDEKQMRMMVVGDGVNDIVRRNEWKVQGKIEFYVAMEQANKLQLSRHLMSGSMLMNKSQT
jgi:hypothetical protein